MVGWTFLGELLVRLYAVRPGLKRPGNLPCLSQDREGTVHSTFHPIRLADKPSRIVCIQTLIAERWLRD
jgi:hypothetical protein